MSRRVCTSKWIAALALVAGGAVSFAAASEPGKGEADEAYQLTLQVVGSLGSCNDDWSGPEYYATASRRDLVIEEDLDRIRKELSNPTPRLGAFNERLDPLLPREYNTVALSEDERLELDKLRKRRPVLKRELENTGETHESQALRRELSELDASVQRLENSIPLSDEEARFLKQQKAQRAPLLARSRALGARKDELGDLISMRTPGSLRVYPNDQLLVRMMENDPFKDDLCDSWRLTLDRETLDKNGLELKRGDHTLLRLWLLPDSP